MTSSHPLAVPAAAQATSRRSRSGSPCWRRGPRACVGERAQGRRARPAAGQNTRASPAQLAARRIATPPAGASGPTWSRSSPTTCAPTTCGGCPTCAIWSPSRGSTSATRSRATRLCAPARSSLLTGQYAHNTGVSLRRRPRTNFHAFDDRADARHRDERRRLQHALPRQVHERLRRRRVARSRSGTPSATCHRGGPTGGERSRDRRTAASTRRDLQLLQRAAQPQRQDRRPAQRRVPDGCGGPDRATDGHEVPPLPQAVLPLLRTDRAARRRAAGEGRPDAARSAGHRAEGALQDRRPARACPRHVRRPDPACLRPASRRQRQPAGHQQTAPADALAAAHRRRREGRDAVGSPGSEPSRSSCSTSRSTS